MRDTELGIERQDCLKLNRSVEMLQWTQSKTEEEGKGVKLVYKIDWKSVVVDSDKFRDKNYTNPFKSFVFENKVF
jgi:hypothetical protein